MHQWSRQWGHFIRQISSNRAYQMAFNRFLLNKKCTAGEIEKSLAEKTNKACLEKKHVLCLQDTVEMNYSSHPEKKENLESTEIRRKKKMRYYQSCLASIRIP